MTEPSDRMIEPRTEPTKVDYGSKEIDVRRVRKNLKEREIRALCGRVEHIDLVIYSKSTKNRL